MTRVRINTTCIGCDMKMRTTRLDGVATCHSCRAAAKPPIAEGAKLCIVDGCEREHCARGYCTLHYGRNKLHGDPSVSLKGQTYRTVTLDDGRRVCRSCGEPKPANDYHADGASPDGLRAQCKACRGKYMQCYHEENADKRREYMNNRRMTFGDHVRALDTARYERDKDKRVALATEQTHIRRARMREVEHERGITVIALRKRQGDNCCYCGVEMDFQRGSKGAISPFRATLEHILPISRGGGHTWQNAALACHACNTSKNNKTVDEWSRWKLEQPT